MISLTGIGITVFDIRVNWIFNNIMNCTISSKNMSNAIVFIDGIYSGISHLTARHKQRKDFRAEV